MIELLAPAGDEKSFIQAINHGANAIYLGLSEFSARKNAQNFTKENISYYVSYAHLFGVKVYCAINTLVKDEEIELLLSTVETAHNAGVDAFILQDIFLGRLLREYFPEISLHLSTQAGVNEESVATLAKNEGFSRVILARETNISEIAKITKIIETEVFVQGALCTCFSGHCYMSAYIGGNSGNRGYCKQPCRKTYSLEGNNKAKYPISLSDLCLADYMQALKDAGVSSVKIEGRMRSPEYVASAVRLYRRVIDGEKYDLEEVTRTYNRGNYTKGYTFGVDKNIISQKVQNHLGKMIGVVKSIYRDTIKINRFNHVGDAFKIISNGYEVGNAICIEDGNTLKFKGNVKLNDEVYITKDVLLSDELLSVTRKHPLKVFVKAIEGEKLSLSAEGVEVVSSESIQSAKNAPTTEEEIYKNLLRTDKYPFEISYEIEISKNPFIPKSVLNNLRAKLYEKVFFKNVKTCKIKEYIGDFTENYELNYNNLILSDVGVDVGAKNAFILHPNNYMNKFDIIKQLEKVTGDKYLFVPSFLPSDDKRVIESLLPLFDGIYADGLSGIELAKRLKLKLICGLGLNVFNSVDLSRLKEITSDIVLSQELSDVEINGLPIKSGYKFSIGQIRLMELLYCPFGGRCESCKNNGNWFSMTDEKGRKVKIRRYKVLGKCRFEVYNEQILYSKTENSNFYNLIGFNEEEIVLLTCSNPEIIRNKFKTTVGNSKRGVN